MASDEEWGLKAYLAEADVRLRVLEVATQEIMRSTSFGDPALAQRFTEKATDMARGNPNERTVEPEAVPAYAVQYPLWKRLYAQTHDIMKALP